MSDYLEGWVAEAPWTWQWHDEPPITRCVITLNHTTGIGHLDLSWLVKSPNTAAIMDELQRTYEAKQTIEDTIQRLAVLGFNPSFELCNESGTRLTRSLGVALSRRLVSQ